MSVNKTNVKDIERNFAKFDLALICEEKYKALKHIDMVVYTMLKNQESLSIASVKNGNMKYVDKNGFIFISISQDKLCKILRTTKPTLKASLDRLAKCELVESVNVGTMKCNRIYVGNAESNITLGEYVKKIGAELDEEQEEKTPSINVVNVSDENKKVAPAPTETTNNKTDNKNIDTDSIPQNEKKYTKKINENYTNKQKNILSLLNSRGIEDVKIEEALNIFTDIDKLEKCIDKCINYNKKNFNYLKAVYEDKKQYGNNSSNNKFHNFNPTFTKYSEDELNEIIEKSQKAKFGNSNSNNSSEVGTYGEEY